MSEGTTTPEGTNSATIAEEAEDDRSSWVHPKRFTHAINKRDEYKAQAEALQERLAQMEGRLGALDTVQQTVKSLETDLTNERQRFGLFKEVTAHQITEPDLIDAVTSHYQSIPESKRPKVGDLLGGWKQALTAEDGDPSTVPFLLRPHLQRTWAAGNTSTATEPEPRGGHNPSTSPGSPGGPAGDHSRIFDLTRQLIDGKIDRDAYDKQVAAIRKAAAGVR